MISIIAAVASNGAIGNDNKLLWHISEDLRRFKAITAGHPVIMGRKTYESIGKPLPDRKNIIITRNVNYRADGCLVVPSLNEAIESDGDDPEIFIIGGGEIYRQAMGIAGRIYLTRIEKDYRADTFFPSIDEDLWVKTFTERHTHGEKFEYPFTFENYERIR